MWTPPWLCSAPQRCAPRTAARRPAPSSWRPDDERRHRPRHHGDRRHRLVRRDRGPLDRGRLERSRRQHRGVAGTPPRHDGPGPAPPPTPVRSPPGPMTSPARCRSRGRAGQRPAPRTAPSRPRTTPRPRRLERPRAAHRPRRRERPSPRSRPPLAPAGLDPESYRERDLTDTGRYSLAVKGGVAAALIAVAAGGSTAVAMDKEVTVTVDGVDQTVHTFSGTVGGALYSGDIAVGPPTRCPRRRPRDPRRRPPRRQPPAPAQPGGRRQAADHLDDGQHRRRRPRADRSPDAGGGRLGADRLRSSPRTA